MARADTPAGVKARGRRGSIGRSATVLGCAMLFLFLFLSSHG